MSEQSKQELTIQRLYMKDLSWEAPGTPAIFDHEWQPNMHLDVGVNTQDLGENNHEVVLNLTTTVKSNDAVIFIVEVKYAGVFKVSGFNPTDLGAILGSYCPSMIYPYAREVVSSCVSRGSFPQLVLAPINFDQMYADQLQQAQSA
jgi:preprotein translocase subunit SecB